MKQAIKVAQPVERTKSGLSIALIMATRKRRTETTIKPLRFK